MNYESLRRRYYWNESDTLGESGFRSFYLAFDRFLNRQVVLQKCPTKIIDKEFSLEAEVAFLKTQLADPHPNIIHYETYWQDSGNDFAVLPYYSDGNLQRLLEKGGLTEAQKVKIATQILEGMRHYQKIPIVHGDLKPSNIWMARDHTGEYVPKIGGFGFSNLAVVNAKIGVRNVFQQNRSHYSAPEQLTEAAQLELGLNTDLWSYGVLVYQLFTGELPYSNDSARSPSLPKNWSAHLWSYGVLVYQLFTGELPYSNDSARSPSLPKDWSAHLGVLKLGLPLPKLELLPERFQRIVSRCLVFDPNERVLNAATFFRIEPRRKSRTESKPEKDVFNRIELLWVIGVVMLMVGGLWVVTFM